MPLLSIAPILFVVESEWGSVHTVLIHLFTLYGTVNPFNLMNSVNYKICVLKPCLWTAWKFFRIGVNGSSTTPLVSNTCLILISLFCLWLRQADKLPGRSLWPQSNTSGVGSLVFFLLVIFFFGSYGRKRGQRFHIIIRRAQTLPISETWIREICSLAVILF